MEVWRRWWPGIGGLALGALYLWVLPSMMGPETSIPPILQGLINGGIFISLTLTLLIAVTLLSGLPPKVEVWESEGYAPGKGAAKRERDLKGAGLTPRAPIKVSMSGGVNLIPLESPEGDITATVFDLGFMAGIDLVSHFEGGFMLFTGDKRDGGTLPHHPKDLRQILPGGKAGALLMAHRRALRHLESRGLKLKAISVEDLPGAIELFQRRTRAHFLEAPYKNVIIATLRTITRQNPFMKPIEEQGPELRR